MLISTGSMTKACSISVSVGNSDYGVHLVSGFKHDLRGWAWWWHLRSQNLGSHWEDFEFKVSLGYKGNPVSNKNNSYYNYIRDFKNGLPIVLLACCKCSINVIYKIMILTKKKPLFSFYFSYSCQSRSLSRLEMRQMESSNDALPLLGLFMKCSLWGLIWLLQDLEEWYSFLGLLRISFFSKTIFSPLNVNPLYDLN